MLRPWLSMQDRAQAGPSLVSHLNMFVCLTGLTGLASKR